MSTVFLSYDRRDQERIEFLRSVLEKFGHEVWMDDRLPCEEQYEDVLMHQIAVADAVVVLWTDHSVDPEKAWVAKEAKAAQEQDKLISVRYELDYGSIPDFVRKSHVQKLDGWDWKSKDFEGIRKLNAAIFRVEERRVLKTFKNKLPNSLKNIGGDLKAIDIILKSSFGGIRVHRLVVGTGMLTALIWLVLFVAQLIDPSLTDHGGIDVTDIMKIAACVFVLRLLHEINFVMKSSNAEDYVNQFFESDFAFNILVSFFGGGIFAAFAEIFQPTGSLYNIAEQTVEFGGYVLLVLLTVQITLTGSKKLHKRID